MKQIKINNSDSINLEKLIDTRLLVQANSGGGKSWLLRRLLEQSHGKVQQIVIDLEGEFNTLREKFDYILAGKNGDTPAEPKSAALLARKILEMNVSAIIDLYELPHQERKRFVRLFLESMVNAPKELWHPCLVIIDEAHVFCPEKGQSEAMEAVIDLATRGRKRGYCAVLATQRLSKLHKDAAAECNNKLIGRTGLDIDMKRASEELGFTTKEQYLSLRKLSEGEFFAFGPAISNEIKKVKIGNVQTTHPKAGSRILTKKPAPPTSKIKSVLKKLADLPEEAQKEAKTVNELKEQIKTLKVHRCPKVNSKEDIDRAINVALQKKDREFHRERTEWQKQINNFFNIIEQIGKLVSSTVKIKVPEIKNPPIGILKVTLPKDLGSTRYVKPEKQPIGILEDVDLEFQISSSQQKIIDALSFLESVNIETAPKAQVALFAGSSPTSGGYFNNLGALRTAGFISYPSPGQVALTEIGRESANPQDIPTTDAELHDQLFRRLSNSQRKILRVLIDNYPNKISKDELAELAEQSSTSGGYFNNLGRLRSLKLIDYPSPGMTVALPILFFE